MANAYQSLLKAKAQFCKGKTNTATVKAVAAKYVKSAVSKGRTKAAAEASAKRVLTAGCSMSSSIAKAKKGGIKKAGVGRPKAVGRPRTKRA